MSSRKALRDFYKLQSEAGPSEALEPAPEPNSATEAPENEPENEPVPGLLEPEEESLTSLKELDESDLDIGEFVHKLAAEQSLTSFVATAHQICREQATLTSAQRELVYDNYKKLIQAAETLGYLSVQGDLAELDSLASSVQVIADVTRNIAGATKSDSTQLREELRRKAAALEGVDRKPASADA